MRLFCGKSQNAYLMNKNLLGGKFASMLIVIFSFAAVSVNLISNLDLHQIEILADFDFEGFLEETDLGEDGDSFFLPYSESIQMELNSDISSNHHFFVDPFIPGVISPPPELV